MDTEVVCNNRLCALASEIRTAHGGVLDAARTRAQRALDAGAALIEAKGLLRHGRWLPWLREHCRLPERTAQLYMKLAALEVPPELIAALGMEQAAQSDARWRLRVQKPDPLAARGEQGAREWRVFAAFTGSAEHVFWLMRQGFSSPDAWLGEEGAQYRVRFGMAEPGAAVVTRWTAFREEHAAMSQAELEAELAG